MRHHLHLRACPLVRPRGQNNEQMQCSLKKLKIHKVSHLENRTQTEKAITKGKNWVLKVPDAFSNNYLSQPL